MVALLANVSLVLKMLRNDISKMSETEYRHYVVVCQDLLQGQEEEFIELINVDLKCASDRCVAWADHYGNDSVYAVASNDTYLSLKEIIPITYHMCAGRITYDEAVNQVYQVVAGHMQTAALLGAANQGNPDTHGLLASERHWLKLWEDRYLHIHPNVRDAIELANMAYKNGERLR